MRKSALFLDARKIFISKAFSKIPFPLGQARSKGDGTDFLSRVILDYSGIFTNKMIGLRAHIT